MLNSKFTTDAVSGRANALFIPKDMSKDQMLDQVKDFLSKHLAQALVDNVINKIVPLIIGAIIDAAAPVVLPAVKWITTQLQTIMPYLLMAVDYARKGLLIFAEFLDSVFNVTLIHVPKVMDDVAHMYRVGWAFYMVMLVLLALGLLGYALWVYLYRKGGDRDYSDSPDAGFFEKLCNCCKRYSDTDCCLWSVILVLEIIILVTFLVCIVLAVLAAVKYLMATACEQIYILTSEEIALDAINFLAGVFTHFWNFMSDLWGTLGVEMHKLGEGELHHAITEPLVVCYHTKGDLKTSVYLTVFGALCSAIFSYHMLIDLAILHTKGKYDKDFGPDE
jgi:hypothetical protein